MKLKQHIETLKELRSILFIEKLIYVLQPGWFNLITVNTVPRQVFYYVTHKVMQLGEFDKESEEI